MSFILHDVWEDLQKVSKRNIFPHHTSSRVCTRHSCITQVYHSNVLTNHVSNLLIAFFEEIRIFSKKLNQIFIKITHKMVASLMLNFFGSEIDECGLERMQMKGWKNWQIIARTIYSKKNRKVHVWILTQDGN